MEHWFIDQKSSQHGSQNPKTTVSKYPNKHNQCNTCSDSVQKCLTKVLLIIRSIGNMEGRFTKKVCCNLHRCFVWINMYENSVNPNCKSCIDQICLKQNSS